MVTLNIEILARLFRNFKNKSKTHYFLYVTNTKYKIIATDIDYKNVVIFTIEEPQFIDSDIVICFEIPLELQEFLDAFKLKTLNTELTLENKYKQVTIAYEDILNVVVDQVNIRALVKSDYEIDYIVPFNFSNVIKVLDFIPVKLDKFLFSLNDYIKILDVTKQFYFEIVLPIIDTEEQFLIDNPNHLTATLSRFKLDNSELMYSDDCLLFKSFTDLKLKDKSIIKIAILVMPNLLDLGNYLEYRDLDRLDFLTLENSTQVTIKQESIEELSNKDKTEFIDLTSTIRFNMDWFNKVVKSNISYIQQVLYKDNKIQIIYDFEGIYIKGLSTLYKKVDDTEVKEYMDGLDIQIEEFSDYTDVAIDTEL